MTNLPSQIKPLFNLELGQPFLLRPLHQIEIDIVNEWVEFFNNRTEEQMSIPVNRLMGPFRSMLSSKNYGASTLRPINGRSDQSFQGLFIARQTIDVFSAVCKIAGNEIELAPVEKRMAFREAVAYYLATNTDPKRPLPNLNIMDEYSRQRMFLPNTGIICPSGTAFKYTQKPLNVSALFVQYARFFDIPNDISVQDLQTIMPNAIVDIRAVHEKLKAYREVMQHNLGIALPDLDVDRPGSDEEILQIATKTSEMFKQIDQHDSALTEMLEEFDMRRGQIDIDVPQDQRPEPLGVSLRIPKRARISSSPETLQSFINVWNFVNPAGINIKERILADPPRVAFFKDTRSLQNIIINEYSELSAHCCNKLGIPSFIVPTTQEITRYKGKCGGRGLLAILRDIEDIVWPYDYLDESVLGIGIVFSPDQRSQLITLKSLYNNAQNRDPKLAPRAVLRPLPELQKSKPAVIQNGTKPKGVNKRLAASELARKQKLVHRIRIDEQKDAKKLAIAQQRLEERARLRQVKLEEKEAAKQLAIQQRLEESERLLQELAAQELAAQELAAQKLAAQKLAAQKLAAQKPIVDIELQQKRIKNLEDMIIKEWVKKSLANENYTMEDFLRYLLRNYDNDLILEGDDPNKRLFQDVSKNGEVLSFEEGLKARIEKEVKPSDVTLGLGREIAQPHFVLTISSRNV